MTPSEELELKIYRYAESVGKARWRATSLPGLSSALQFTEHLVLVDALHDLHARTFLEVRQIDRNRSEWVLYDGGRRTFFNGDFSMRVTFSGRKYFERLEAKVTERVQSGADTKPHSQPQAVLTPESASPRAFVSHSTQDRSFVERFAGDLRKYGVDAWYSGWDIKPGDSIRDKIDAGLEGCEFFIIVLSKTSVSRPWVKVELDSATVRKINGKVRKIIPVKIEDCGDLPPTLGALCWEDFSNQPYDAALGRVLGSIFEVDLRPPLGTPPSPTRRPDVTPTVEIPAEEKSEYSSMTFPIHMDDLDIFVSRLRVEGFDARADLFNGQVGLIVGPKGLDTKRLPPDTAGLFFPLWELNYKGNRDWVEKRTFHYIFENRPPGWQFNRPYQHNMDHERLNLRHWNRSVSSLGNKKLQEGIQQELIRRFPPSEFPVNIDVVGSQEHTYLTVHVTDLDSEISEKVKAVPEDFLGSGGIIAAVLAAAGGVMSELQKAGRIPTTPQHPTTLTRLELTLHAIARAGVIPDLTKWDDAIQFEVRGLPSGERAWIANFGNRYEQNWRILRAQHEVQSDWTGSYRSAEEALAILQKEFGGQK